MTRILIIDDHPVVRNGLKEILVRKLEGVVCGEAGDGRQGIAEVESHRWELVILDITMPGLSGLSVLVELKRIQPKLPILVLSVYSEDQYAKRVLQAGASGYMNKESAPEELIQAVHKLLAGGRYVSSALAEKLVFALNEETVKPRHETLSAREFEVLRMIALGKTVSQIADQLHLSGTTVSTYRARILEKLNITTTAELMRYALHNQLVE